jgi:SAM-dependent methyltransferase
MNKPSGDYHDYVFRGGELVGQFEEMYKNSESVPWHQDKQADWIDLRLTTEMLKDLGPFDEIHDLGCGLGNYLALMVERLGSKNVRGFGYDISRTACEKASREFPIFQFLPLDLTNLCPSTLTHISSSEALPEARRLFMIRGTLWYVFPKLGIVIENIVSMMRGDDRLLVVQNFPPLASFFIGKDVIPNHKILISHFSSNMSILRHIWYEDSSKSTNDNWFVGVFCLKDN